VIYWIQPKHLGKVLLAGVFLAIGARIMLEDSALNVYRFSLTRFDSLLMGSLLALEFRSVRGLCKNSTALLAGATLLLVIFILAVGGTSNQATAHRLFGYCSSHCFTSVLSGVSSHRMIHRVGNHYSETGSCAGAASSATASISCIGLSFSF